MEISGYHERPSDRETMKEFLEENAKGGVVGDLGSSLVHVLDRGRNPSICMGNLPREHGWICVGLHYTKGNDDELVVQFAPLDKVVD